MHRTTQIADAKFAEYATKGDFCRIFAQEMDSLYLLSFLLTADHEKAEQCFVAGLEQSVEGNRVFKDWARSWARRMIIQSALRAVAPRPFTGTNVAPPVSTNNNEKASLAREREIGAILELPSFDRLVYVMSVLERFSDHDCSLFLGCARHDVLAARNRALQQVAAAAESHREQQSNSVLDVPTLHHSTSGSFELQSYAKSA